MEELQVQDQMNREKLCAFQAATWLSTVSKAGGRDLVTL
jgi:hypothetical protein